MSTTFHEHELEFEGLGEHEHEHEHEQFFGSLAKLASRALGSPALRQAAGQAARSALQGLLGEGEGEGEGELEGLGELELEGEGELSPIRKVYTDAMMEHMAHVAAESESEHEAAEALLPLFPVLASKLAPLALKALPRLGAKLAPRLVSRVMRVTPQLTRGLGRVTQTLYRNPRMRPLIRVLPTVARQTTAQLVRRAISGRPITPSYAVRTLAQQTARVLGSPRRCAHAWHGARSLDRRYHRANPQGVCLGCLRRGRRVAHATGGGTSSGNGTGYRRAGGGYGAPVVRRTGGAACVKCC
jgi:hypothetical protein